MAPAPWLVVGWSARCRRRCRRFDRLAAVVSAVDALIAPDALRRDSLGHDQRVGTLFRAVKPDPAALEIAERTAGIATLVAATRAKLSPSPPDISAILGQIGELLDESITSLAIRDGGPAAIDLSKINFAALAPRFKKSKHKNTDLEALKAAIRARLERLVRLSRTRAESPTSAQATALRLAPL